jgi:hypothetical protein
MNLQRSTLICVASLALLGCRASSEARSDAGATIDGGAVSDPFAGAFGAFGVFGDEFPDFRKATGLDFSAYQAWAGDRMKELGARWTRSNLQLVWDFIEPKVGGPRDWRASFGGESVFAAAASRGVHYLAVFHPGDGPKGPPGGRPPTRNPLDQVPEWQRFVQAAVERFDGDGVDDAPGEVVIKHWQLGNEIQDWTDSGRDASQYAAFVEVTVEAVRRADPGAKIVLIAETEGKRLGEFYRAVIQALAAKKASFDAVDIHDYSELAASRTRSVPEMRAALDAAGFTGVEIWSAEHGSYVGEVATNAGTQCAPPCDAAHVCHPIGVCLPRCAGDYDCPPASGWVCDAKKTGLCHPNLPAQSEREQARSLVYRFAINRQAGVRRIMWATLPSWRCFSGECNGLFDRVGLVSGGFLAEESAADVGRKRLAFHSYRLLAERTDEPTADLDGEVTTGDRELHLFRYRNRRSGQRALVAWSDVAKTATLSWDAASARLTGLITDGTSSPLRSEQLAVSSGKVSVALDADPVWISQSATW